MLPFSGAGKRTTKRKVEFFRIALAQQTPFVLFVLVQVKEKGRSFSGRLRRSLNFLITKILND